MPFDPQKAIKAHRKACERHYSNLMSEYQAMAEIYEKYEPSEYATYMVELARGVHALWGEHRKVFKAFLGIPYESEAEQGGE